MRKFTQLFKAIPRYFAALPVLFMVGVMSVNAIAAPAIHLESTTRVANVTKGDTTYKSSVNADYDDVVRVQLWYHNMEKANSGLIAEDLTAKVTAPAQAGAVQTITGQVSAKNANTVTSTATVNLGRNDAYLEYIPGSAQWRHNAGTNSSVNYVTTKISDNVVTTGAGLRLEDAKPCFNFEASVYVMFRVRVPSMEFTKKVSTPGNPAGWMEDVQVKSGDTVKFLFTARNRGNKTLTNVRVGDVFPEGITYKPGSTVVTNSNHPNGVTISVDDIANGGLNIGSLAPGGTTYVTVEATVGNAEIFECGVNELTNKGVVQSDQTPIQTDTADISVERVCEAPEGDFSCDALTAKRLVGNKFEFTAEGSADNATIESYAFQFGDGNGQVVTSNETDTVVRHSYANPGKYTARVTVRANVDGETQSATGRQCAVTVNTAVTPTTPGGKLPDTGIASVFGGLFGTGSLVAAVRGWVTSRRSLKKNLLKA